MREALTHRRHYNAWRNSCEGDLYAGEIWMMNSTKSERQQMLRKVQLQLSKLKPR
jgi:hypothetical protein